MKAIPPIKKRDPDAVAPIAVQPDGAILLHGRDLQPVPIDWLWRHWLARGKFHLLAGAPGQGKTTLAMALAATITAGGRFPDGSASRAGNVLVWTGEDDPRDTLLPRFLASGGDAQRLHFISGVRIGGEEQPFDPGRDIPALAKAIGDLDGVDLLVVDPVVGAVTGDSHKNTETRRGLQPLMNLAEATGCAVLGITHFSKGGQGVDPAQRVIGSIAFTAAARIVLVAAKVRGEGDDSDKRILARAKSNIGPDDGGFEYFIKQGEPIPGIPASCVTWGGSVAGSARDLLTDPNDDAEEGDSTKDLPRLIWQELRDGMQPSKRVEASLKEAGFTEKQIRTARQKMNVKAKKSGMEGGWYWQLVDGFTPEKAWLEEGEFVTLVGSGCAEDARRCPEGAEDAHVLKRASSDKKGIFGAELNTDSVTNSGDEKGVVIPFKAPETDAGKEVF